jgi:hypothetical protein
LDWGSPDGEITKRAHEEERGREERNEEVRKKRHDRIVMQTRTPASLVPYTSTMEPRWPAPFCPSESVGVVLHGS